jgi:hypothetical protein
MVKHTHDKFVVGGNTLHPAQHKLARIVYEVYYDLTHALPKTFIEVSEYLDGEETKSLDTLHLYVRLGLFNEHCISLTLVQTEVKVSSNLPNLNGIRIDSYEAIKSFVNQAVLTLNLN